MVVKVTNENVNEILQNQKITVLVFSAPWCGPCKVLSPIIDELAEDNVNNSDLKIGKINVDENVEISKEYGIRGIPSILFFKDGVHVSGITGLKTKLELQNKIDSLN